MKPILFNFTDAELEQFIADLGQPKFRAKQIREWLNRGAPDFASMKNLPESLRIQLDNAARTLPVTIKQKLESSDGQTTKFLLECYGNSHRPGRGVAPLAVTGGGSENTPSNTNEIIECVLMRTTYGNSVCVSSQAGCAMGCKFCASTLLGLKRNLSINEMFAQVLIAEWQLKQSKELRVESKNNNSSLSTLHSNNHMSDEVTHVVIMGTGEPLQNTENTIGFMERLHDDLEIGWRKITLSTCGIVSGIRRLTNWGKPINLAISLHAPNNNLRGQLMPINERFPIADVLDAAFENADAHNRQLMIEYILLGHPQIDGTAFLYNCNPAQAEELAHLLKGKNCMVNLIPWNTVDEREFSAPSGNAVHRFQNILIENGIHTRIRRERGTDIGSACGQLRLNNAK